MIAVAGFLFAERMPIGRGRVGVRHCVPNVSSMANGQPIVIDTMRERRSFAETAATRLRKINDNYEKLDADVWDEATSPVGDLETSERAALRYLERYASSSENPPRLTRRVERSACAHGTIVKKARPVDEIVRKFKEGYLNDRAYAKCGWVDCTVGVPPVA